MRTTEKQLIACGLEETEASQIAAAVNSLLAEKAAADCWRAVSRDILLPRHPFALHQFLYEKVYADWDTATHGPPPAWFPSETDIAQANITQLMEKLQIETYREFHAWSVDNRAAFWEMMVETLGIHVPLKPLKVETAGRTLNITDCAYNIAESCFNADDDAPAIIAQSEGDATLRTFTYRELERLTNRVANGLVDIGIETGDAVAVDMPMNAESIAIYLGSVKAGCAVVSIADSFAPDEIATRNRIGKAKAIFTQDAIYRGGKRLPLYEKVIAADAPKAIVLSATKGSAQSQREEDLTWNDFLSERETFTAVPCHPEAHTNILFSSGTTGEPKAIPWTHTTPIKCAADAFLHHDIHPGDVLAWPTNLGWMMGPWLIYASLINRATIALYNGVPTGREFGTFVQNAKVSLLGVVPTLVRAWKNSGCMQGLDWRAIRAFSSTGECSNPEEMLFLMSLAGYQPVIEYCGGTEIGGAYVTGTRVQPAAPSIFSTPALGLDFVLCDEDGNLADNGEVFIVPPSIGLSTSLLNTNHDDVYFSGTPQPDLRRHGDALERLANGYYRIHGRVDDTMNLSGIKVSSAEIEEVLNTVEGIRETAAVAVSPKDGGPSRLVIYVVVENAASGNYPASGADAEQEIREVLQAALSQRLNPLFRIHEVVIVDALPRTASNKVMRRLLRSQKTAFLSIACVRMG